MAALGDRSLATDGSLATPSTACDSPPITLSAKSDAARSSLKRATVGRPESKVMADGTACKEATMEKVVATTVPCDESGQPVAKDADFTHYKTTFKTFVAAEMRCVDGIYNPMPTDIMSVGALREFVMQIGSEPQMHAVSGFVLLVEKSHLSLPQDVSVSFDYTSPQGGDWFVDGHKLVLTSKAEAAGSCCALQ